MEIAKTEGAFVELKHSKYNMTRQFPNELGEKARIHNRYLIHHDIICILHFLRPGLKSWHIVGRYYCMSLHELVRAYVTSPIHRFVSLLPWWM
jgi:hypothetical protein